MPCRYWTLTDNFEWAFGFAPRVNGLLQRHRAAYWSCHAEVAIVEKLLTLSSLSLCLSELSEGHDLRD